MLTAQDIEILLADYFGYRRMLIVPNVWWGWNLRHEADLLICRPSGWVEEVEIKVSAGDIRADTKKSHGHHSDRIRKLWFAVPSRLAGHPDIPVRAGVLEIRVKWQHVEPDGHCVWSDEQIAERDVPIYSVNRVRRAMDNPGSQRVTDEQRIKLAELGAMRIWDLKKHCQRFRTDRLERQKKEGRT